MLQLYDEIVMVLMDALDEFDAWLSGVRDWLWSQHSSNRGKSLLELRRPYR